MACGSESSAHSILLHIQGSLLEDRAWGWSSTLQHVLASGNTWRGWPSMALTVYRTRHCWGQEGAGHNMLGFCFSPKLLVTLLLIFFPLDVSSGKNMLDCRVFERPPSSEALQLGDFQKENCVRLCSLLSLQMGLWSLVGVSELRTLCFVLPKHLELVGGERLCDCSSMNGAPPIREGGSTVHWVQGIPVSECLWPWIAKPSFWEPRIMELETKNGENRVLVSQDQKVLPWFWRKSQKGNSDGILQSSRAAPSRKGWPTYGSPQSPTLTTPFPPVGHLGPSQPVWLELHLPLHVSLNILCPLCPPGLQLEFPMEFPRSLWLQTSAGMQGSPERIPDLPWVAAHMAPEPPFISIKWVTSIFSTGFLGGASRHYHQRSASPVSGSVAFGMTCSESPLSLLQPLPVRTMLPTHWQWVWQLTCFGQRNLSGSTMCLFQVEHKEPSCGSPIALFSRLGDCWVPQTDCFWILRP